MIEQIVISVAREKNRLFAKIPNDVKDSMSSRTDVLMIATKKLHSYNFNESTPLANTEYLHAPQK